MLTKLKKLGISREIGMQTGLDTTTKVLPSVSFRSKIRQDIRRGFPTKFLPMLQGPTVIRNLTQSHKEEKVVVLKVVNQILPSVARGMDEGTSLKGYFLLL